MRILMVTPRFLPSTGGVELHVAEVARRIVREGHEVSILTTDRSGRLPARETWEGVGVERVRAWPRRRDYYFAPGLVPRIGRGRWDVVHVQSYHTLVAPVAMATARLASIPYVVTFHAGGHSSRLRTSARGTQLALLRPLLARAARLVALAEFEIDEYGRRLRLPRERFALVPNGSDLPARTRPSVDGPDSGSLIASIGRLERYKGHQHVIAALPLILHERPDARLWIAGSGPDRQRLEELAERLGVSSRTVIRAVPPEDRARMADELSRVRVAVLASRFETHPIAMLEAAALGCRVVVADSPGLRELGERGLARVVARPEEPTQLADAVLAELEEPRVPRALELSSWDDCAAGLCELYASVAGKPSRR
jgi:glycogen synthase